MSSLQSMGGFFFSRIQQIAAMFKKDTQNYAKKKTVFE